MSHQDSSVFVDASGRRRRGMRWAAAGVGTACLGFLAVVVAGSFGAGPVGGPLPWADRDKQDAPALIQPDPVRSEDVEATPQHTTEPPADTASPEATEAEPPAEAATTGPAPAPSPTGGGTGDTEAPAPTATDDGKPGKSDQAPGATKRPK
ncbi:hypothetical protein ACFW2Y_07195 [Streptomyces sp. NPDC058877]|uniref:hypothetical protein n=1 Tax=unclassified Streptomyces TaxID=2593676 RepID=UPI0036A95412